MTSQPIRTKGVSSPTIMPIILSAAQPGAGQFAQRRWVAGTFYCVAYMVCVFLVVMPIFGAMCANLKTALAFLDQQPNQPFAGIEWKSLVIPFLVAMFLWLAGIVDTFIAYKRDCAAWSRRKLDERLGKTAVIVAFFLVMLASNVKAATGAADLFAAISSNDLVRAEAVIKSSLATIEARTGDGITPLHVAAAKNLKDMIALLIRNGADPDARTTGGFTPLHWAAGKDAADAAGLLIRVGAEVNAANPQGITPLHWAASKNATNVVRLLIAAGADPDARTATGFTPLHWARMQRADEAAIIIADKAASEKMIAETNELAAGSAPLPGNAGPTQQVETTAANMESIQPEAQPVVVSKSLPILSAENELIVPLGHDEELDFVWVKDMGIWVGKFEITNGQYRRFSPDHNSRFRDKFNLDGRNQPVAYVSWTDATAFCKWLNKNYADRLPSNCEFRLPTGNEWIGFARCGDNRKYPWGNELPPGYGNYSDLAAKDKLSDWKGMTSYNDGFAVSCPVEDSGVNEWGIYGVGGNVWEWCNDWYDAGKKYKVRHGGSWDDYDDASLSVETPGFDRPDTRDDTIGFRVVVNRKG